ncbi:T7SS effector LXG polymorphic toxin [Listeria ivanovii]|uniref:T7SS effector LXG polymorphic toxin n=2 Tax=Listeria ivanovii TaxID=1638 RepID=UPI0019407A60|nr:T7SS effector LXG polymorphic toxin [Listeria ivanovii]MBM5720260.1 transposase [Listeria ivanovii]
MTRIDIAEVQQFAHGIKANNQEAKEHIQKTQIAIQNFVNDQSITGQAISSAKVYFSAAYFSLCQSIIQALNVSEHSLQQYIIDFHDQVDASPNAKLDMNNLMVLEDKIEKYESKKDQLLAEISNVSNAINGALGGSGQQDSLKIRGLTADITEAHKKERILEKYMDFERSHVGFSDELSDLAYAIQLTVADIKQNLTFNDKTGLFDVSDLHIDRFKKLHELYAKQKEIDDKVKELESIGLTPYIPSGNTAGFILNQDGTLNTDATLNQVNNQIIYWKNETGMRELFGIGAFYRAIYGTDYVSGEDISKGRRFFDGMSVTAIYSAPYGITMGLKTNIPTTNIKIINDLNELSPLLKTNSDEAFFWSGRTNGIGGADAAEKIATSKNGVTLESTIKNKGIKMPEWNFDNPKTIIDWEGVSEIYASQVTGEVRAVVGSELRKGNIWENVELPRLKANPNVTKITTVDPVTQKEKIIFERK